MQNNRASMRFEAQGKTYQGVGTLLRQAGIGTKITFHLPPGTIIFQIDNCARERVEIRPKGDKYVYDFNPSIFKEAEDSCIMQAQATTFKGEILTSLIDWTDRRELKGRLWCNEEQDMPMEGVALCQLRATKLLWLEFADDTVVAIQEGCPKPTTPRNAKPGRVYEVEVGPGLCAYGFMDKSRKKFRLTTYGYQTIREVSIEAEKIK